MNSTETIATDAVMNSSHQENNNDIWQPMNNNTDNRMLSENASTILHNKNYHFEPIDHDFSSSSISTQTNNSHLIQRPIPIERPKKQQQQYATQIKRNSAINITSSDIDSTIRSYTLSRSITSSHLANNNTTRSNYRYYPSVQDVLNALNRSSFDRESFV